ncbi:MAG: hypothetical protein P4L40_10640 [Terracidiphilus sp.]|nr:hypothetical protein [Terracidiphilus sp.]
MQPDRAKSAALGVGSTLLPAIEDSTFLVSHPINAPGRRTVTFVVRCDAANVISYQLPDSVREGRAKMDASVLCSVPTMMMAAYGPAAGAFDTLDYSPLAEDVKAGKLLVVTHADPWGVMVSATQASAWVSLLKSLGGKYASLAEQASHSSHIMQRHPLIDLI